MLSRNPIGSARKMPLVHQPRRPVNDGCEIHSREDVPVQVDAGRDLDQLETLVAE
jgi:hypothetical protein